MNDLIDWLLKNPSKAANEIEHLREWKQAIDDALICAHIGTADSFPDARTALNALCAWCEQIALDPAVSQDARALIDKGRSEASASLHAKWCRSRKGKNYECDCKGV